MDRFDQTGVEDGFGDCWAWQKPRRHCMNPGSMYVRVFFDSHFCSQSVLLEPCLRRFLLLCEAPGILLASRQKVGEVNFCVIQLVNGVGWHLGLFSGVVAIEYFL